MRTNSIKSIILPSLLLALMALMLSALAAPKWPEDNTVSPQPESESGGNGQESSSPTSDGLTVSGDGFDASYTLTLLDGDETLELTIAEYLQGSLAAEMPASFEPEALCAQAVALRTYVLRKCLAGPSDSHPEADVCSDSGCCAAWRSEQALRENWGEDSEANFEKIRSAIQATDGVCVSYEGSLAQTVFHSSSDGMTAGSGEIWSSVPYLTPVESPERSDDVPGYIQSVTVSTGDFKDTILSAYPEADLSGKPETWVSGTALTDSGRVDHITVGGVDIPGSALRTLFSLRSTSIDLELSGDGFIFTTTGYGHGVGMSQYGANTMARNGGSWNEILAWYYPGTQLVSAWDMVGQE